MTYAIARQYALRLLRNAGMSKPAIDVEAIVASVGLQIHRTAIPNQVSGFLLSRGSLSAICLQASDSLERQRFTTAHELGHWCLKHHMQAGSHVHVNRGNLIVERGRRATEGVDPKEIEANQFAAELLMPAHMVKDQVALRTTPLCDRDVSELSTIFKVSELAMSIRLRNLRLS